MKLHIARPHPIVALALHAVARAPAQIRAAIADMPPAGDLTPAAN